MRRDYKHLYRTAPIPFGRVAARYTDPVRTDEERRGIASRLAKQRAELRRAKIAERWIVFTLAAMLAITMLPVVVAVGAILLARALWRRYARGGERPRIPVTTDGTHMPGGSSWRRGSIDLPATAAPELPEFSVGNACAA